MEITHCGECPFLAPIESNEVALLHHQILSTGEDCGVCLRYTRDPNRPIIKNKNGFCDKGRPKDENV